MQGNVERIVFSDEAVNRGKVCPYRHCKSYNQVHNSERFDAKPCVLKISRFDFSRELVCLAMYFTFVS